AAVRGKALFSNLRQRIRGRVNEDLRQRIELAAARTEVALLRRHTDNALAFVDVLEEELSLPEAVQIYVQALDLRDSIAEVVYYLTLAESADRRLPPRRGPRRGCAPPQAHGHRAGVRGRAGGRAVAPRGGADLRPGAGPARLGRRGGLLPHARGDRAPPAPASPRAGAARRGAGGRRP